MPPKQTTGAAKRGRPSKQSTATTKKRTSSSKAVDDADPFASSEAEDQDDDVEVLDSDEGAPQRRRSQGRPAGPGRARAQALDSDEDVDFEAAGNTSTARAVSRAGPQTVEDEDEDPPEKTIPPALLARLLQEMFEKDGTRMTGDAARAAAKYVDVFVREAIARCIHERDSAFLEVSFPSWTLGSALASD